MELIYIFGHRNTEQNNTDAHKFANIFSSINAGSFLSKCKTKKLESVMFFKLFHVFKVKDPRFEAFLLSPLGSLHVNGANSVRDGIISCDHCTSGARSHMHQKHRPRASYVNKANRSSDNNTQRHCDCMLCSGRHCSTISQLSIEMCCLMLIAALFMPITLIVNTILR